MHFTILFAWAYIFKGLSSVQGIVNLNQQSANSLSKWIVQTMNTLDPRIWHSGVDCITEISKIYFEKRETLTRSSNVVVTNVVNMTPPAAQIQTEYFKYINEAVTNSTIQHLFQLRVISDLKPYNRSQDQIYGGVFMADYYVIIIDNIAWLHVLLQKYASRMSSWNPGARFLVLYNNASEYDSEDETVLAIYTEMLKEFYIHRIAVMYAVDSKKYSISSLDYFNKKSCRSIISRKLGSCEDGNVKPNPIAVKIAIEQVQNHADSVNCTFNVCASIWEPFVEEDCDAGLELRIIALIKQRLGLNIRYICLRESRGIPENEDDEKWSGLLGKLKLGDCDFIVGGFYPDNEVNNFFWTSDCYFDDSHTWFIKIANERPEWMALYSIFSTRMWLSFVLMLPITWCFWYCLVKTLPEPKNCKEFSLVGINNMAIVICVAINERPLCLTTRLFWIVLSLYGMTLVAVYTSRMISLFAHPGFLHQIDNIGEVIKERIPFGGAEESHDWFENDNDLVIYNLYNHSELFEPSYENLLAVKMGQRVLLSGRMYVTMQNISDDVYAFPDNVFSSPVQMIMKPGFPFMYEINWLIRYMRDGGILTRFKNRFHFNNTYLNRIAKMRPEFTETNIVITVNHLQGPFLILIMGIFLSTIFFLIEIYMKRSERKAKRKKDTTKKLSTNYKNRKSKRKTKNKKDKVVKESRNDQMKMRQRKGNNGTTKNPFNTEHNMRFTPIERRKAATNNFPRYWQ